MSEQSFERWEEQIRDTARAFTYPPTPDIAGRFAGQPDVRGPRRARPIRAPRLAWAVVALLVLLACLLAAPPVRAQILEFLQIGLIRIFLVEPTPTPTTLSPSGTPDPSTSGVGDSPVVTTAASRTPGPFPLNLLGETTLEEASRKVPFEIQLPAYPEDLGEPHQVYLQDLTGHVLVMVWFDQDGAEDVSMSLHIYAGSSVTGEKIQPRLVQETQVDGQPAIWARGPYVLKLRNGNMEVISLVEGHVLIWESGEVTFRLETDLPLEEAVRIAESLQPYTPPDPIIP